MLVAQTFMPVKLALIAISGRATKQIIKKSIKIDNKNVCFFKYITTIKCYNNKKLIIFNIVIKA